MVVTNSSIFIDSSYYHHFTGLISSVASIHTFKKNSSGGSLFLRVFKGYKGYDLY